MKVYFESHDSAPNTPFSPSCKHLVVSNSLPGYLGDKEIQV